MKKIITTSLIATLLLVLSSSTVFAQSDDIKEAIDNTEESTNELIEAKDEESPFTLSQRIKALKNVIDLSLSETKDMKVKLLSLDIEDEDIEPWRDSTVERLNEIVSHYEEVDQFIKENEDNITQEEIIEEAREFKNWRDENYIPIHDTIRSFILMKKEEQMIDTANDRWNRIQKDTEVLRQANIGDVSSLDEMLNRSKDLIEKGSEQNEKAMSLFKEMISKDLEEQATSTDMEIATTTTSTDIMSTSSTSTLLDNSTTTELEIETSTTTQSTSTDNNVTSTLELENTTSTDDNVKTSTTTPDSLNLSIRDLVGSSLENVRESYRVFIEMSNFVRELLE